MPSPEYTALKHHVPTAVGVKLADVAVAVLPAAAVTITGEPTALPPVAQPLALVSGPQTKKLTEPVGLPPVALPVTVAPSLLVPPSATPAEVGLVVVLVLAVVTVKHSVLLPSVEAA